MPPRLARGVLLLATGLAASAGGCFLVTGGTSGYAAAPPEAGICAVDAGLGSAVSCGCASSADCQGEGGAYCCFAFDMASLSATSSCGSTPCDAATAVQLCKTTAECADAACELSTCTFDGLSLPVQACGGVSGCTP